MRRPAETRTAFFFLLPAFAVIFLFHVIPAFYAWYISFFKFDNLSPMIFTGFSNYARLLKDAMFWKSLFNTFYFAAGTIPLSIIISVFIAVLLNQKIRGLSFFRTAYFLPVITSMNAVAMVWLWIFQPDIGVLNYILGFFGVSRINWLMDPVWAMPAVIMVSVWKNIGYNIIIFLVGLQSIPSEYYEAAQLDGAGDMQTFGHVTWPLLMPTVFFVTLISLINSFHTFTQIYMLTPDGGPLKSTSVIVFYLYENAFKNFEMGYASAISFVVFLITFVLTVLQNKFWGSKIHYGN